MAGLVDRPYQGRVFNDSDLYKWLEAASWALVRGPNPGLERLVEQGIALAEGAQQADGYLDTYYSLERASERWSNLRDNHELYCAGHLMQAAVAHHRATGSERLLRVATRFADLICTEFGPPGSGRRHGIDGHQEVEMALVELYRETGQRRYLEQAAYFVEARGHGLLEGGWFGRTYFQDHAPFRALERMAGHAVRALYYVCGVTDLYLETGDRSLLDALERLWTRMVARQIYLSGGVGSRHDGESFGDDHELPNGRAYTETCAAIGSAMWCHRMLAATGAGPLRGPARVDAPQRVLPGWSIDGRSYLYVNPLEDDGGHRRQPWYHCACCPPNLARTIASLPGYVYGTRDDALFVHLYAQGTATVELGGRTVLVTQRTRYPWDGRVELQVDGEGEFALHLRVPGWVGDGSALSVNGETAGGPLRPGTYAELRRRWRRGRPRPPLAPHAGALPRSAPSRARGRGAGGADAWANPLLRRGGGPPRGGPARPGGGPGAVARGGLECRPARGRGGDPGPGGRPSAARGVARQALPPGRGSARPGRRRSRWSSRRCPTWPGGTARPARCGFGCGGRGRGEPPHLCSSSWPSGTTTSWPW